MCDGGAIAALQAMRRAMAWRCCGFAGMGCTLPVAAVMRLCGVWDARCLMLRFCGRCDDPIVKEIINGIL